MEAGLRKRVVGTFKYGRLLSKTDLVTRLAAAGVNIPILAFLFWIVFTEKSVYIIVGGIIGGLWLFAVLCLLAGAISDLLNRRLIDDVLKRSDLSEGKIADFRTPSLLFLKKVRLEVSLSGRVLSKTFRLADRTLYRGLREGRMTALYSASRDAVVVIQ